MSVALPVPVAMAHCPQTTSNMLAECIPQLFAACGITYRPGERVLVKPNLVAAKNPLGCTDPAVAAAACQYLLDCGARVTVADSPAFGSAESVARKCGLVDALAPLGLTVTTLRDPRPLALSFPAQVGIATQALEADRILNLPRLKAHCQMRLTASVKNLFGCVCGMRKAIAHTRFGERGNRFEALILDVCAALPQVDTLLDAVTAMHVSGPTDGEALHMGLLAASPNPVALDTALYTLLTQTPDNVALWREAIRRDLPGCRPQDISYPLHPPQAFDATAFIVPEALVPVSFRPARLAKSAMKRLLARIR